MPKIMPQGLKGPFNKNLRLLPIVIFPLVLGLEKLDRPPLYRGSFFQAKPQPSYHVFASLKDLENPYPFKPINSTISGFSAKLGYMSA